MLIAPGYYKVPKAFFVVAPPPHPRKGARLP